MRHPPAASSGFAPALAELTDGVTTGIEEITEELTLGSSWLWCTRDGQDDWHTVVDVKRLHGRTDGVGFRVTLEHRRRPE